MVSLKNDILQPSEMKEETLLNYLCWQDGYSSHFVVSAFELWESLKFCSHSNLQNKLQVSQIIKHEQLIN